MFSDTRKVFAIAGMIVATGITVVELTRSAAQAEGTQSYAASRVASVFEVVATMPEVEPVRVPMATKGDLPVPFGCTGIEADAQAECMDVAYEVPSEPSIVVESRYGNTSTLTRMDAMTIAEAAAAERVRRSE